MMWDEETLFNDYKELIFDAMNKMEKHKGDLTEKLINGYNLGMSDALTIFQSQVGKWEILFEMRKESLKEK